MIFSTIRKINPIVNCYSVRLPDYRFEKNASSTLMGLGALADKISSVAEPTR